MFKVRQDHRNYLRFFWYANNDKRELVEYRMRVHVFEKRLSPVVATYGLRKTTSNGEPEFGSEIEIRRTKFLC